ncbi:hypothetical protein PV04_04742 [Phialophora macrospora]|uniref:Uncharacterized protein n=1 Tax=Phialophora macrospora TaxID=1851006 RepID=A0A0D2E3A1_9EURO|nr:hypothetical protein PV04_04742 [Phialophora macrospora]
MAVIEQRQPDDAGQGQWLSYTTSSSAPPVWTTTTTNAWVPSSYTTETGWVTSYTTTTECDCDWVTITTSSSWCPTPIIIVTQTPTTTSLIPIVTTSPASAIVVDHRSHGLSPGAVGGIVVGVFFGVLLLFLLCLCCFRSFWGGRRRRRYGSDSSSSSSSDRPRRKPPIVIMDPYPRRPEANLTFVGGGNYPGTRVMVTKTQKIFIRPPPTRQVRTVRESRREKIVVVEDD